MLIQKEQSTFKKEISTRRTEASNYWKVCFFFFSIYNFYIIISWVYVLLFLEPILREIQLTFTIVVFCIFILNQSINIISFFFSFFLLILYCHLLHSISTSPSIYHPLFLILYCVLFIEWTIPKRSSRDWSKWKNPLEFLQKIWHTFKQPPQV